LYNILSVPLLFRPHPFALAASGVPQSHSSFWTFALTVRFLGGASLCPLSRRTRKRFFLTSVLVRPTLLFGRWSDDWSRHFIMTASKIFICIYSHGHGYLELHSKKMAWLKERADTLVFQPHYTIHSCDTSKPLKMSQIKIAVCYRFWSEHIFFIKFLLFMM
jgi:hypothetical protein